MTKTNKTLLCALLALVLTLACALTIMPVAGTKANAAEETIILSFPDANSANNKKSGYTNEWIAMVDTYQWNIVNFNNNSWNNSWTYIKAGSKSTASTASIEATNIAQKVSRVVVSYKATNFSTNVTEYYLEKTTAGKTEKITLGSSDLTDETMSFKISTPEENSTYKLVFVCKKSSSNGILQINTVQYIYENAPSHTHAYSEWAHVDGTKTHVKTCNVDGCDAPTVTEACTIVNNVCTVCNYDYTAKFTVKETVVAEEGQTSLAVDAEGQFSVTYTVTANQGINMMQGDLAYNSEKLTLVSVEAGNAFGNDEKGNNNITVTNDVTLAEQKVVASVVEGKTGVLVTVTYQLKAGVTEVGAGDFGMTVKATAGNEYVAEGVATVEANTITVVVLKGVTITLDDVALTYTGASLTVGAGKDVAYTTTHGKDYTGEAVVTWYTVSGEQLTEVTEAKNVGAYQVKVEFPAKDGYAAAEATANVTVNAKEINVSFAAENGYGRKAFGADGKAVWNNAGEFVATVSGLVGDDTVSGTIAFEVVSGYELDKANLTSGATELTGKVSLVYTLGDEFVNYTFAGGKTATGDVEVTAYIADLTVTVSLETEVYYGTTLDFNGNITVKDSSGSDVTANSTITMTVNGKTFDYTTKTLTNAGEYAVVIKVVCNGAEGHLTQTYTIKAITITVGEADYATDGQVHYGVTFDSAVAGTIDATVDGVALTADGITIVASKDLRLTEEGNHIATLANGTNYVFAEGTTLTTKAVYIAKFNAALPDSSEKLIADQYRFEGQKFSAPELTFDGYKLLGWFEENAETAFDFTATGATANIMLTAKWEEILGEHKLTLVVYYNEKVVETLTYDNVKANTEFTATAIENFYTAKDASWLAFDGYFAGSDFATKITTMPNAETTIYAKYELAIGLGDVDGDKNVGNGDIVLYRQYIVGGYKITVVEAGKEYEEASKTLAAEYVRFFAAVANVDGVADSANDIRDIATLRMAMVEQDGYKVVGGAVVAPEKADSGNAETQAVNTKIENRIYALLPTTFGVGKAA